LIAATDTFNLYNADMVGSYNGITRSGSSGSNPYSTVSGRANELPFSGGPRLSDAPA
jgi:hypothetical protein